MIAVRVDYLALGVVIAAFIMVAGLIVFTIATRSTFGQVCVDSGYVGVEVNTCVHNLKYGYRYDML